MLTGSLTACSSNNNEAGNSNAASPVSSGNNAGQASESGNANDAIKDAYEINYAFPVFGAVPKDIDAVQDAVSKITKEKINATVKFHPISIGAWSQQMNLMVSSGEKLDVAFTFGANYTYQAASGQFTALDDLLAKYGEGIEDQVGSDYLKSTAVNGKIYGIPTVRDYGGQSGFLMRKDLADKYNIDVASIHTLDDLEKVFKTIKDNEPGIVPIASGIGNFGETYLTYDKLDDRYGVLPNFDNGLKVVNWFETPEYADQLNRLHKWFKAGYINKDAATTTMVEPDIVKAGTAFGYFAKNKPSFVEDQSRLTNYPMVFANLMPEGYSTTSDVQVGMYTISQNSKNPERAMMFLKLMYTDVDVANLLMWGIEGKHYVKTGDTTIDYPAGVNAGNVGYSTQNWLMGNTFLTYTLPTMDPDVWKKMKEFNSNLVKSKALGFSFNSAPVQNEITALNNVTQQYRKILETGTVDPTKKLPEFITKLKAAGIDKVIAEKQKQLDAWAAAKQ